MDTNSEKRLASVHPKLAQLIRQIVTTVAFEVRVVQGLRTYAEQDMLYAQGRTRYGPVVTNARGGYSYHNFGFAVDLCPFKNGKPEWDNGAGFNAIGWRAKGWGLSWGGDWKKFIDKPHVQLQSIPTPAECRALYKQGGLEKVWSRVK